jgi:hypothetical protein
MRKVPIFGILLLIPAFTMFTAVGCKKTETGPQGGTSDGEAQHKEKTTPIDKPTTGTIKGVVTYKGTPPKPKELAKIQEHTDKKYCLTGKDIDKDDQTWIIGEGNGVGNVVIALAPPSGKSFKITDELKKPFKDNPAVLDQPYCMYRPHILALYAGVQPLILKNSADIPHNVKVQAGPKDGTFDSGSMRPKSEIKQGPYTMFPDAIINISCSMHNWMTGKAHLFAHPYFAVSSEKDGTFEIKHVPIDTELTVRMWHDSTNKWEEPKKITAKAGDNDLALEIWAK